MFGHLSATMNCRANATLTVKHYSKIAVLDIANYNEIVRLHPRVQVLMRRIVMKSTGDPINSFFMNHFRLFSIFKGISKNTARELSLHCYFQSYVKGQVILEPGSNCSSIYMLMSGVVSVYIKKKNDNQLE
jgi:hypothetical protein